MNRDNAIDYLEGKGKIDGTTTYDKKDEELIKQVMKEGKIFGDPIVILKK